MSSRTTQGIRVSVSSAYVAEHSKPRLDYYVFGYTVDIANVGTVPAQLVSRHWIITNARGVVEEVQGPGVVGETPRLAPGESFRYSSGCALATPSGIMQGLYQMVRDDGDTFDAIIDPFHLTATSFPAAQLA